MSWMFVKSVNIYEIFAIKMYLTLTFTKDYGQIVMSASFHHLRDIRK